jgi:hypothetical protein
VDGLPCAWHSEGQGFESLGSTTTSGDPTYVDHRMRALQGLIHIYVESFRIIPRPRESTVMVEPSLWTFAGRSQPCHGFAEPSGS